ncbi:MAG: DNA glycosylase [Fimbriimonadaceae bacterium]
MRVAASELDLKLCLTSGQVFRWRQEAGDVWRGVDGPTWYDISRDGAYLYVKSNAGSKEFTQFFQLDTSASAVVREICEAGPELRPYLAAARGLRTVRYADPVECLFTFLCTANNHVSRIANMVHHLASYGEALGHDSSYRRFPGLDRLGALSEAELRDAGFGYRAASLPAVAKQLVHRGGDAYVHSLKAASLPEFRAELMSLPSIGPKLADCIALFGFGFRRAVPVDTHIWKAATRLYFPQHSGKALTQQKYEEFANFFKNRFGDNAGWAHQALFFDSLSNWRRRKNAPLSAHAP